MLVPSPIELFTEYNTLLNTCYPTNEVVDREIEEIVDIIIDTKKRYQDVSLKSNVPWYVIGVIHSLEASLDFNTHLHNGDSLRRRTTQVPSNRPINGTPPFTWEFSAIDCLEYDGLSHWKDWTVAGTFYKLEAFNGWGSRIYHHINTPYLWSGSNHYERGKYIADGVWSSLAKSEQVGGALIYRRLAERGQMEIAQIPHTLHELATSVMYMARKPTDLLKIETAQKLQKLLNQHPGILLSVDGWAGSLTSGATKHVAGNYLIGDPRS